MEKMRGIVLRVVKYGENGVIADMFTRENGRMSFGMRRPGLAGARKFRRSGAAASSLLLPLSMLEFDCEGGWERRLPTPREPQAYYHFHSLHMHPVKSMLAQFTAEFLSQALREEGPYPLLYDYVESAIEWLDQADGRFANFHIVLMSRLTRFIGIQPYIAPSRRRAAQLPGSTIHFDMQESQLCYLKPDHPYYLCPDEAKAVGYIMHMDFANMHLYRLTRAQRQRILDVIVSYYRLHFPSFAPLKSLEVLRDVMA